jgi:hypothetical protein
MLVSLKLEFEKVSSVFNEWELVGCSMLSVLLDLFSEKPFSEEGFRSFSSNASNDAYANSRLGSSNSKLVLHHQVRSKRFL